MKLTVLGCGDAFGNGGRSNTSFLLTHENEHILVDCGASALIRLKHEQIDPDEISTIIISHFHGDHYGGIPFLLISSLFEKKRIATLNIAGPPGIEAKVLHLLEAMYEGTTEKLNQLDLRFYEYMEGTSLVIDDKKIEVWKVEHSIPSNPHGVRITWKGRVFAYSGDTSWTENLIPLSNNADIFLCDCNFLNSPAFGHLSLKELNERKEFINCDNIWLTHMGSEVLESDDSTFNRLKDGIRIEY
ncbi:MAG: MBL fold metallo-hydrolase [Cyclobacteriaceae bacterium]